MGGTWSELGTRLLSAARTATRAATRAGAGSARTGRPRRGVGGAAGSPGRGYAGDHRGPVPVQYAPDRDGDADPGEVVWAWVPYEEGDGRGKDRPVLVLGRADGYLLALQLSSRDHDLDAADEARYGRSWMDVGTGGWDRRGRPSEVRLDRVLRLDPGAVRREGARLDRDRFDQVAEALHRLRGAG